MVECEVELKRGKRVSIGFRVYFLRRRKAVARFPTSDQ